MVTKKIVTKKSARKSTEKEQPVELKKLIIKIHGKELMLTPQEAKELKGILNELFEESKQVETTIIHEHVYPYTYIYPSVIYVKPYEWTKVWYGDVNTTTGNTWSSGNNISWTTTCNNAGTLTCSCG